jgi:hypothetical protein
VSQGPFSRTMSKTSPGSAMILQRKNGHGHPGAALHHHYAFCNGICDHIFGSCTAVDLERSPIAFWRELHLSSIFGQSLLDPSVNAGIEAPN